MIVCLQLKLLLSVLFSYYCFYVLSCLSWYICLCYTKVILYCPVTIYLNLYIYIYTVSSPGGGVQTSLNHLPLLLHLLLLLTLSFNPPPPTMGKSPRQLITLPRVTGPPYSPQGGWLKTLPTEGLTSHHRYWRYLMICQEGVSLPYHLIISTSLPPHPTYWPNHICLFIRQISPIISS